MKKILPAVVALCFSVTQCFAQVNAQDSLALVALYNSTNGSGWTNKTNWLSGPVDTWYGVTVTGNRVTDLSITNNNMVGSLPSELGDLTAIIGLFLSHNQISGTVPASLSNLKEMETLQISYNNLTGTIPTSLESLEKLKYLDLEYNTLTGSIPPGLKIANAIALGNNQLSGTVPALFCDKYLFIFIKNNQFTFDGMECIGVNDQARPPMTDQIVFYENQKKLLINNSNPILSVTAGGTLNNNTYTWYKDVGDNAYATYTGDSTLQITEPGTYWGIVRNSLASQLILYTDTITIASVLTMLQRDSLALVDLYNDNNGTQWFYADNWLTLNPVSTWYGVYLTGDRVTLLALSENNLSGQLPESLGNLTNLEMLRMSNELNSVYPCLTGPIPESFKNMVNLKELDLRNNDLEGTLDFIGGLTNLEVLKLGANWLSGDIPLSIGNLVNLIELEFWYNRLNGPVPAELCNLPNLIDLDLSMNGFNFDGMECIGQKTPNFYYGAQNNLVISNHNPSLSVTAGGTLSKNTYTWFKDDVLYDTNAGDSTLTITEPGIYRVEVSNSDAAQLTLISNPVNIGSVLPLKWVSFTATKCSKNICLQWQTVNEQNASHFEIERSIDGSSFERLSTLASQNKSGKQTYNATDRLPAYGINYYRVKQVDLDGRYTFSDIISVKLQNTGMLNIFPNPANNFIILKGITKAEKVCLYSMSGQMLRQWQHVNGNQQLNISDLQKGMYILKIENSNFESVQKLIRQ